LEAAAEGTIWVVKGGMAQFRRTYFEKTATADSDDLHSELK
jgi:hypothetical protein